MSIVRINDGLDIKITDDHELEIAMNLFIDYINSAYNDDIDSTNAENERKLNALEDAMNIYDGNYHIIDFY